MPSLPPDVVKDWRIFQVCCIVIIIGLVALIRCHHIDCQKERCACECHQRVVKTETEVKIK